MMHTYLPAGMLVALPQGARICYDTAPKGLGKREFVGRPQIVKVAWMTHSPSYDTIYWAGRGGYWKGVDLTREIVRMNRSAWDGHEGVEIGVPLT